MPASAGNLVVLGEILGPQDFTVLINDSGNVQIFMCNGLIASQIVPRNDNEGYKFPTYTLIRLLKRYVPSFYRCR